MIGLLPIVVSLVVLLSVLVFAWVAVLRPRVTGRPARPIFLLLLLIVPLAIAAQFTAEFLADYRPGVLVLAVIIWGITLWICWKAFQTFRDSSKDLKVEPSPIVEPRPGAAQRNRVLLLLAAGVIAISAGSIDSLADHGITAAWLVSLVLTLLFMAVALLVWRVYLDKIADWFLKRFAPPEENRQPRD